MDNFVAPMFPAVRVKLSGRNGNAYAIIGACQRAARDAGLSPEEIQEFRDEAMSGDYEHLLETCIKWFDCR